MAVCSHRHQWGCTDIHTVCAGSPRRPFLAIVAVFLLQRADPTLNFAAPTDSERAHPGPIALSPELMARFRSQQPPLGAGIRIKGTGTLADLAEFLGPWLGKGSSRDGREGAGPACPPSGNAPRGGVATVGRGTPPALITVTAGKHAAYYADGIFSEPFMARLDQLRQTIPINTTTRPYAGLPYPSVCPICPRSCPAISPPG